MQNEKASDEFVPPTDEQLDDYIRALKHKGRVRKTGNGRVLCTTCPGERDFDCCIPEIPMPPHIRLRLERHLRLQRYVFPIKFAAVWVGLFSLAWGGVFGIVFGVNMLTHWFWG